MDQMNLLRVPRASDNSLTSSEEVTASLVDAASRCSDNSQTWIEDVDPLVEDIASRGVENSHARKEDVTAQFEDFSGWQPWISVWQHFKNYAPTHFDYNNQQSTEDVTAEVIGDFGTWQLRISIMMSLLKLSNAWYQLNIIFMAPPQEFWCAKPPSLNRYSDAEWRSLCKPKVTDSPCLIFDPDLLQLSLSPSISKTHIPLVPCKKFVYDESVFKRTMTSEWDLVCDKHWMVHVPQCVMMCGVLVGGVVFGMLADKYGRKYPLLYSIIIQALCSYIACIITSYWWFLGNWFILALASGGITITSFVLCMEAVSGKWRMIVPIMYQLPYGLGNTVMALLAYWLRDWRKLEFGLATLSSLYILYWFWIPESPRWLLANGQTEKAVEVLQDAAVTNGRSWSARDIRRLLPTNREKQKAPPFVAFLKSRNMRLKTVLLSVNWFCTGLAFYTFSQYLGGLGGNIFLTVAITGIISTPGPIVCVFVITRVGRRMTIWVFQLMTALCFVALLVIPRDQFNNDWPRVLFAGIGFAGLAASVPTLYLYSGELYPTLGRNVGVGAVTTFARVGSMIAPFVVSLESIMTNLPLILLAVTSFAQILLLVPLPETRGRPLPDTLEQAEKMTRSSTTSTNRRFRFR